MREVPRGSLLSITLHLLVALGVSRFAWRASEPAAEAPRAIAWLVPQRALPVLEPAPAAPEPLAPSELERRPELAEPGPEDARAERTTKPPDFASTPVAPTNRSDRAEDGKTSSAAPGAPRSPLDLSDARARAIDSVLKERDVESSYRSFIFPGTLGEQQAFDEAERHRRAEAGLQAPLTAFDSPSKGRAGLKERTALGVSVRWVSDDCYETTGTGNLFILPSLQALVDMPATNCVSPQARGDLFVSAKPAYLMDAGEREAAAEREQRIERLRRPTTGVAMSPED